MHKEGDETLRFREVIKVQLIKSPPYFTQGGLLNVKAVA
jgi:hypothetical protein